ncbi:MAG: hypothetical protein RBT78_00235 [Kiritimatiellia bacterium]|nr:hypothetical protein [Kiritimatiellia bacterium]
MATSNRPVKRTALKPAGKKTAATAARAAAKPASRKAAPAVRRPAAPPVVAQARPAAGSRVPSPAAGARPPVDAARPAAPTAGAAAGPTARTCPLVLDGEIPAAAFTPKACFTCDEFDCRFNAAEEGSGALRSRLFACEEEEEGDEDACDADFGEGEESGFGGTDEEGDDLF